MFNRRTYRRRQTIVLPRIQWRFALQVLSVQLISILAYVAALQLKIVGLLRVTESVDVELALREVFQMGLVTLVIVGPIVSLFVVLMALRLSNTVVGPVPRLRNSIRALADGNYATRIRFRPGDALCGLDDDFNVLAKALEEQDLEREPQPQAISA